MEIFTYNLFVTFLTSQDMSRIITTRSLIDIEQNILCNKGTWNYVFVHTNHLYDVSLYVLNIFFFQMSCTPLYHECFRAI